MVVNSTNYISEGPGPNNSSSISLGLVNKGTPGETRGRKTVVVRYHNGPISPGSEFLSTTSSVTL